MKKYFFFQLITITVCIILFTACSNPHVTDITLNKNELFLTPGETELLIATIYPDDADNKKVTWKSSNPDVTTVNKEGLVVAIKNGEATITVTTKDGKKTAKCTVIVDSDYRRKWVGDWDFEVKATTWSMGTDTRIDTFYYSGKISINNTYFGKIEISFKESYSMILNVDKFGKISDDPYGGYYYLDGQFEGKGKVYLKVISGTIGCITEHIFNGIKEEGGKK
jgi:uncharacterized protein YjdB